MQKEFITTNSKQTQKMGEMLAKEITNATVVCLVGELGAGKTTFTQGFLKGLSAEGPYTSPTFLIMKQYDNVYHFDAYRVDSKDILSLGWEEIIANPQNIVIIEWADKVRDIIPKRAVWIDFGWVDEEKRKIIFKNLSFEIKNLNIQIIPIKEVNSSR
jgi:tRNA threonylcarbamoyladenosine biosynthesis protein TsaE